MERNNIIVKNAHTNNLKNIDIEIPKHNIPMLHYLVSIRKEPAQSATVREW
jgi:Excinuclease ATPase subunit